MADGPLTTLSGGADGPLTALSGDADGPLTALSGGAEGPLTALSGGADVPLATLSGGADVPLTALSGGADRSLTSSTRSLSLTFLVSPLHPNHRNCHLMPQISLKSDHASSPPWSPRGPGHHPHPPTPRQSLLSASTTPADRPEGLIEPKSQHVLPLPTACHGSQLPRKKYKCLTVATGSGLIPSVYHHHQRPLQPGTAARRDSAIS